jgi:hypothetical protein
MTPYMLREKKCTALSAVARRREYRIDCAKSLGGLVGVKNPPFRRKRFELFHRRTPPSRRFFALRLFPTFRSGVVPAAIGGNFGVGVRK